MIGKPAFAPLPRRNRKPAICYHCRRPLRPGTGTAWEMVNRIPDRPVYLCAVCSVRQATEELALMMAQEALDVIYLALGMGRPLGFVDEARVTNAIRRTGARGADGAIEAARRLAGGERLSIWQVCNLIEIGRK